MPRDVQVHECTTNSIKITWNNPESDGGLSLKLFHVKILDHQQGTVIRNLTVQPSETFYVACADKDTLKHNVSYMFEVAAENRKGLGRFARIQGSVQLKPGLAAFNRMQLK
jgi:Fibronectin type III domain